MSRWSRRSQEGSLMDETYLINYVVRLEHIVNDIDLRLKRLENNENSPKLDDIKEFEEFIDNEKKVGEIVEKESIQFRERLSKKIEKNKSISIDDAVQMIQSQIDKFEEMDMIPTDIHYNPLYIINGEDTLSNIEVLIRLFNLKINIDTDADYPYVSARMSDMIERAEKSISPMKLLKKGTVVKTIDGKVGVIIDSGINNNNDNIVVIQLCSDIKEFYYIEDVKEMIQ